MPLRFPGEDIEDMLNYLIGKKPAPLDAESGEQVIPETCRLLLPECGGIKSVEFTKAINIILNN